MPQPKGYSHIQIFLHWSIAAMVVFQLLVNDVMQRAFAERLGGRWLDVFNAATLHIIVGVTILILAVIRLILRVRLGVPPDAKENPPILNWIGHLVHYLLYGFIFGMPLTGAIAWLFGIELAAELHELGRLILIPVIGLHVVGALAEHFVFRNDTLMRMIRATAAE